VVSTAPTFVLRLSKDERRVFQQNHVFKPDPESDPESIPTSNQDCFLREDDIVHIPEIARWETKRGRDAFKVMMSTRDESS